MILRLAMIGYGNVAQEFSRLLLSKREWLWQHEELDVQVGAICTKTRGSLISDKALDLRKTLEICESGKNFRGYGPEFSDQSALETIRNSHIDIVIELTTLNIESGQPAIDHIKTAFEAGISVVTANKGPVAYAYEELRELARRRGAQFRFEGTVMDGTPVFSLVERTLPGCTFHRVAGTLNSTCNFILTRMSTGKSLNEALKEAKKLGVTESDPSMDIEGWDASAKITVLANVLMNAKSNPKLVERKGIVDVELKDLEKAAKAGEKIKLVARAEHVEGIVKTYVRPELIGPESPFWSVDGTSSALTLSTDLMNDITIIENNPKLAQTAYAIFSDILLISEGLTTNRRKSTKKSKRRKAGL